MVLYFLVDSICGLKDEVAHLKEDLQEEDDNPIFEMEDGAGAQTSDPSENDP